MDNAMNKEVFRNIKGYPNYQISNMGRIWNAKTQRYLKPSKKSNGYYQINLVAINGKRKKEYLHRLLALTFIDNPNNYPEIDHIDRNRENNELSNLRWVSKTMNQRNKSDNVKVAQYDKDNNLIASYNSIAEAVEAVNGTVSGIYSYFAGKANYYKGFTWTKL